MKDHQYNGHVFELSADTIYVLPTVMWSRVECEEGHDQGFVIQAMWLGFIATWFWQINEDE